MVFVGQARVPPWSGSRHMNLDSQDGTNGHSRCAAAVDVVDSEKPVFNLFLGQRFVHDAQPLEETLIGIHGGLLEAPFVGDPKKKGLDFHSPAYLPL